MVCPTCFRLFVLALALLAGACNPIQPAASSPPFLLQTESVAAAPSFLPTACLYRIPPDAGVSCGFLLVPEDRSQPDSRTIRLHVLIFKSTNPDPQPDPLILLNGGPGGPSQPMIESMLYDLIGEIWRAARDVIYLDQRGTGFSLPSLYCPEAIIDEPTLTALEYEACVAADTAAMQRCYDRLRGEGIDLAAYSVAESAVDINDLRLVLGYATVNLYGFSYGSLLALTVMHDYPAGIRSVVLDAVLPLGVDVVQEKPGCLQSGLNSLFAGCAADATCQAAYPELEAHFYAVLDRLHASPATVALMVSDQEHLIVLDDLNFCTISWVNCKQVRLANSQPRSRRRLTATTPRQPGVG